MDKIAYRLINSDIEVNADGVRVRADDDGCFRVAPGSRVEEILLLAGAVPAYKQSEALPVIQNPSTGGMSAGGENFLDGIWLGKRFFAGSTYASALAAINAAYSAGGGLVEFPRAVIDLGAHYLPIKDGVHYKGQGFALTYSTIPDDPFVDIDESKGTVLKNNGSAPIFWDEKTDMSQSYPQTPTGQGQFCNDATHTSIRGFAFKSATHGIKIGANYAPGAFYFAVEDCVSVGCSQWGFWFENMIHGRYDRLYAYKNTVGQMMFISSSVSAVLLPANTVVGEIVATAAQSYLSRGIEVRCKNGTGGGWAAASVVQSNRFNMTGFVAQTATCDGSANISVTDGTKFLAGLPVYFSSVGATGLSTAKCYVVLSVTGNTITIANSHASAALTPTAGTATIESKGFAPLTAVGEGSSDRVQLGTIENLDLEAGGTSKFWGTNIRGCLLKTAGCITSDGSSFAEIVTRNAGQDVVIEAAAELIYDCDNKFVKVIGPVKSMVNNLLPFFGRLNGAGESLNLAANGTKASFTNKAPGNGDFTLPGVPVGRAIYTSTTATQSFNAGKVADLLVFTGTSTGTWTFNQDAGSNMPGYTFAVKNAGTAALTFTLGGTGNGTFEGTGKASVTLPAPTATTMGGYFECCCTASGVWVITAMAGGAALA